jgi:hypothetical protein
VLNIVFSAVFFKLLERGTFFRFNSCHLQKNYLPYNFLRFSILFLEAEPTLSSTITCSTLNASFFAKVLT